MQQIKIVGIFLIHVLYSGKTQLILRLVILVCSQTSAAGDSGSRSCSHQIQSSFHLPLNFKAILIMATREPQSAARRCEHSD